MKFSNGQKHSGFIPLLFIPHYVALCANDSILFTAHTPTTLPSVACIIYIYIYIYTELDVVVAHTVGQNCTKKTNLLKDCFSTAPFHSLN